MKISKRGEYALRSLINLGFAAEAEAGSLVQVSELAEAEQLPVKFLEQILQSLKEAGFVESARGKFGGYRLAKPAGKITIGSVVRLIDGPLAPIGCVSQTAYEPCTCPDEAHCGLRMLMIDVRNAIAGILDRYSLADVVDVSLRKMRRDGIPLPFSAEATTPRRPPGCRPGWRAELARACHRPAPFPDRGRHPAPARRLHHLTAMTRLIPAPPQILALFCGLSIAAARAEDVTLRVGYFPNVTHAQGIIGSETTREGHGWFEQRLGPGVTVQWYAFNAGPSAMEAIFAGSIDLTYTGPNPVLNAYIRSRGDEIRVLAGAAEGGAALVVAGNGPIRQPADFKGKRIATPAAGQHAGRRRARLADQAGLQDHPDGRRCPRRPGGQRRSAGPFSARQGGRRLDG